MSCIMATSRSGRNKTITLLLVPKLNQTLAPVFHCGITLAVCLVSHATDLAVRGESSVLLLLLGRSGSQQLAQLLAVKVDASAT